MDLAQVRGWAKLAGWEIDPTLQPYTFNGFPGFGWVAWAQILVSDPCEDPIRTQTLD